MVNISIKPGFSHKGSKSHVSLPQSEDKRKVLSIDLNDVIYNIVNIYLHIYLLQKVAIGK